MSTYAKPPGWYVDQAGERRYWTGSSWSAPHPRDPAQVPDQPAFYLAKGGPRASAPALQMSVPRGGLHPVVAGALNTPSALRRSLARLLDELLLLVVSLPVLVPMAAAAQQRVQENIGTLDLSDAAGLLNGLGLADVLGRLDVGVIRILHVALLLRVAYLAVGIVVLRSTVGKRLLRMRVVRTGDAPSEAGRLRRPTPQQAAALVLAEALVLLVALHLLPVALLLIVVNGGAGVVDARRRTLLERGIGTRTVVYKRLPRGERQQIAEMA